MGEIFLLTKRFKCFLSDAAITKFFRPGMDSWGGGHRQWGGVIVPQTDESEMEAKWEPPRRKPLPWARMFSPSMGCFGQCPTIR